MKLNRGEVLLVEAPFHQRLGGKVRPVVMVLDAGDDDFLALPITSVSHAHVLDIPINDLRTAGLHTVSFARVHKIGVLHKLGIRRRLGDLSSNDWNTVATSLCNVLC